MRCAQRLCVKDEERKNRMRRTNSDKEKKVTGEFFEKYKISKKISIQVVKFKSRGKQNS